MVRPCFLVIDQEHPDSISTRKLVLETAKYNVITAYSGQEAIATFKLFPKVAGIVMNEEIADMDAETLVQEFRAIDPNVLLVVTSVHGLDRSVKHYHRVSSFDPAALLDLLRELVPNLYETVASQRSEG